MSLKRSYSGIRQAFINELMTPTEYGGKPTIMKIIAASICKQGGREYNQDYVAHVIEGDKACFVVCDGLGSYVGSEVASMLCTGKILDSFKTDINEEQDVTTLETALAYCQAAHNHVSSFKKKNPLISSSCTTVACVITDLKTSVMSHIGDSRVYFFDGGQLKYQSKDHSLAQVAVDMGKCALKDIRTHKDQNKLTRVLGSDYYTEPDVKRETAPLKIGDAFILCTDGFWEYIFEEEMEVALAACSTPKEVLENLEKLLLERVPSYNDNYTATVVMIVE